MQFKKIFIFETLLIFFIFFSLNFVFGLKSKRFTVSGEEEFKKGRLDNCYIDTSGFLSLTPTCEKIKKLKESVVWRVINAGLNTYVTTGHSGKLYMWDKDDKQVIYESSAKELTALLYWRGDMLIGSGPKGILYRLTSGNHSLEAFAILPSTFIWDIVEYGDVILAATGNDGAVYKINSKGEYELFFKSTEDNVLKLGIHNGRIFAATSGQGYLYELNAEGGGVLKYDAGGRDISDFTFVQNKIYLVTAGKKIEKKTKENTGENIYFQNALVQVDLDGDAKELFILKDQTIPTVVAVNNEELYLGTAEKGEIYTYNISTGETLMLYVIKDASIAHFYKKKEEVYFTSGTDSSLYRVSLSYPKNGEYISHIFDSQGQPDWGQIEVHTWEKTTNYIIYTRTGPSFVPDEYWGDWMVCSNSLIQSKKSRFIQFKLKLYAEPSQKKEIDKIISITVNYSKQNTRPIIHYIRLGKNLDIEKKYKISLNKHEQIISWQASDEDGDLLLYNLHYKQHGDTKWSVLEEKIETSFVLINTLAFPNSDYLFKLVASDEKGNTPQSVLQSELVSRVMTIDNTPPSITEVKVLQDRIDFTLQDGESPIEKLAYSIDKKKFNHIYPLDGIFDDKKEKFSIKFSINQKRKDLKKIIIYGEDRFGNTVIQSLDLE